MESPRSSRKKILFILPYMGGGGAERVVLTILRHISRTEFEPVLALFERKGDYLGLVPDDVEIINLRASRALRAILKIPVLLRQTRPGYVFSSLGHVNLLLGLIRPLLPGNICFIARESNTASVQIQEEKLPWISSFLYKHVYNNFDLIIAQSNAMKQDLVENYGTQAEKISVIYNPVDIARIEQAADQPTDDSISLPADRINLLAAGRLSYQKGFDLLISALQQLDSRFYVTILGDGEEREKLQQQARDLGVADRINLAGYTSNPYRLMAQADLLVLSSRYEGLPNVVLEANVCGAPVVAFDSPGGTGEIVKEQLNGFLVKELDAELLAQNIVEAAGFNFDREAIRHYVHSKFDADNITGEYERCLLALQNLQSFKSATHTGSKTW